MLAPETQSVSNGMIDHGRGHGPSAEQPADRSKLQAALEFSQRRLKAKRRPLRRAVGVFEAAAGDADLRILIHEVDERLEGVWPNDRVRVQQQKVLRRIGRFQRGPQDRVVAAGEAEVDVERRQRAPGCPAIVVDRLLDALGRVVSGAVLADRDMGAGNAADFLCDRMQAIDRKMGDAIVNNDDEQFHASETILVQAIGKH